MKIDHLLERSEGISGEILVSRSGFHIYQARVNMLGPTAKKSLANELNERINTIDWRIVVEQAFTKTLDLFRKGDEVVQVGHLPKRESPKYRVKPFVLEKELNALYAFGGTGKSTFSQFLATLVQCGVNAVGMTVQKGNTLILDWETSREKVDENIQAIKKGLGITQPEEPFYRRCYRPLASEIYTVQAIVAEKDIKFVIIDSANMAAGISESFHTPALGMVGALRSLNCSVLIIDHKPKKGETMFGSIIKTNACRALWELQSQQDEQTKELDLGFFQDKHNDFKWPPFGLHCILKGDEEHLNEIVFSRQEVANMSEVGKTLTLGARILAHLRKHPMLAEEISEDLDAKKDSVKMTLTRLRKEGKVVNLPDNQWGLVAREGR